MRKTKRKWSEDKSKFRPLTHHLFIDSQGHIHVLIWRGTAKIFLGRDQLAKKKQHFFFLLQFLLCHNFFFLGIWRGPGPLPIPPKPVPLDSHAILYEELHHFSLTSKEVITFHRDN
jgi:hypothetical protein